MKLRIIIILAPVPLVVLFSYVLISHRIGQSKFARLLSGDSTVKVKSISFEFVNHSIDIANKDQLNYLCRQFRQSEKTRHEGWGTGKLTIHFEGIGVLKTEVRYSGESISIADPNEKPIEFGWATRDIVLENPPKEIESYFKTVSKLYGETPRPGD